ncbi:MAG: ABC transporter permease [Candidatus Lokiarchaeota archaeon]|nr:ABC transporter permease [Candidatus Lokiarchaeota archaeon]
MNSLEMNVIEEEDLKTSFLDEKTRAQKIVGNSFLRLILRKLVFYFLVFFIAITLAFLIPRLVPGSPLYYIRDLSGSINPVDAAIIIAELEALFGLDLPLWNQYLIFLEQFFLHGNLGVSINLPTIAEPVFDLIAPRIPFTLMIVIPALIITFFVGNWVGAWVGYKETKPRKVVYYTFLIMGAAPFYWFAYVLTDIFVQYLHFFPPFTSTPEFSFDLAVILEIMKHYWLPLILMVLVNIGGWSTGARSMMIYERGSGYILYSQKLGFKESKLRKYAYRNSILPQFTGLNLNFNNMIGQTIILEFVLFWPGLGSLMISAFTQGDYAMIMGTFIIIILVIVIGNFLIDLSYGLLDPRIRIGGSE